MANLHFGCCLACRAPFMQSTEFYNIEESQAIFYLQMRFHQLSKARPSQYTGPLHAAHILPKSRYGPAYTFLARRMAAADLRGSIPGQDSPNDTGLTLATCFSAPYVLNRRGQEPDTDSDEAEEVADAIDEAGRRAAEALQVPRTRAGRRAAAVAGAREGAAIMADRRLGRRNYLAYWARPAPIAHAGLKAWLEGLPAACLAADKIWQCDPELKYPCCSLCNTIFDTWARMSDVLRQLVPPGAITACNALQKRDKAHVPAPTTAANFRSHNAKYLAAMAAHYLHASWNGVLPAAPAAPIPAAYTAQRDLATMLMWLPLHVTTTYLESVERITGRNIKGDHNYQGNLDHLIAYHQYLCAYAGDTHDGGVDFAQFSIFYIKELPEAPPTVWDAALYPRVSDFVFDDTAPGADNTLGLVQHASDRLMLLYTTVTAHLVPMFKGLPCTHPDPRFNGDADAFFIDLRERQDFLRAYDRGANTESIKFFIDHAGAAATLWQNHRYLAREPSLQALVTDWLNAQLVREFTNIADHYAQLTVYQAQLLYNMQCMMYPELLVGTRAAIATGVELELLARIDNEALLDSIEASPRCSVWKAARRLRWWNFTRPAVRIPDLSARFADAPRQPPRPSRAELRERREALAAAMRSPDAAYPILGLDTPHLRAIFGTDPDRRPPLALLLRPRRAPAPDQPVRTSLSNWASLRARLISSRLAMTFRSSDSPVGCHAAPILAASFRGWRGRPAAAGAKWAALGGAVAGAGSSTAW